MFDIPRIAEAFYSTPWAILPSKLDAMAFVIEARQEGVEFSADDIRAAVGDRAAHKRPAQADSIAMIPVYGVISKRMDMFSDFSGGTSTDALVRSIQEAVDDPNISAIVLDVDSPGGSVNGPEELSQAIFAARGRKPIIAVVNELMASAAYWIASAADEIVTAPTAGVGSIGVLSVHREQSKADAARGVKTTYIHAGKHKVAGNPSEPLSDESRAVIQERVDAFYSLFVNAVARNRGISRDKALAMADGRLLIGQKAVDAGMADRIGTLQQVISELVSGTVPRRQGSRAESTPKQESAMGPENKPGGTGENTNTNATTAPAETSAQMQARIRREEIARGNTLRGMCNGFWPNDSARANQVANLLIDNGSNETDAKVYIFDQLAQERKPLGTGGSGDGSGDGGFNHMGGPIVAGRAQADKFAELVADGLALRLLGDRAAYFHRNRATGRYETVTGAGGRLMLPTRARTISSDAHIFRGMRMMDIASEHLRMFGISTRGMAPNDIARMALGWEREGLPKASGGEYHRSADFPYILMDAANKTLLNAYMEAPATYRTWVKIGDSVPDFKNINRMRLGEASDLELIPEGNPFPQDKLTESKETYAVQTRGKGWSFTRQMLINDDLGAFNTLPVRYGRAAERTVNRAVYAILTSNPNMSDGNPLFDATHSNVITTGTGSAAPGVAAFNEMQRLLRLQTGLNTDNPVTLNTEMKYIIVPAGLEGSLLEFLSATANPANSNPGVRNIWQNRVTPVVEAILDGAGDSNPTTRYFGAADPRDVDTIEVTFLQGEETPVVEEDYCFETKGRKFTEHQTFGVKAIDWRGFVRNKGS